MEEIGEIKKKKSILLPASTNIKPKLENIDHSLKLMLPREIQNANSLIYSQNNLNKYRWEDQGETILNSPNLILSNEDRRILKFLHIKKIPDEKRSKLWLLTSGAKREKVNSPFYYKNLTEDFPNSVPSPYYEQIEMDLLRTFPEDPFFKNEQIILKLRNILLAYSRRNISIGYCQGFNFIVGNLLRTLDDEEDAFWVFVQIVEQYLPLNFYSNMAGVLVDSAIFNRLLQIYLPDLYAFFINNNFEMNLNNIIFKWFVSLFSNYLPENLNLIFWDVFFLEGCMTLFKAAIGIFKSLKKEIMKEDRGIDELQELIEIEAKNYLDSSQFVYYLLLRRFEFKIDFINRNRVIFEDIIIQTYFQNCHEKYKKERDQFLEDSKNNKIKIEDLRRNSNFSDCECNIEWPLCVYDTYYKHNINNYLIFKTGTDFTLIENYFFPNKILENELTSNKSFNGSINSNELSDTEKEKMTNNNNENYLYGNTNQKLKNLKTSLKTLCGSKEKLAEREKDIIHEEYSLVEENDDDSSSKEANLNFEMEANIQFNSEEINNKIKSGEVINYFEENLKLRTLKDLLIERREHYCQLLPFQVEDRKVSIDKTDEYESGSVENSKSFSEIADFQSKRKSTIRHIKSYTDTKPFKDKFFKTEDQNINFGSAILSIRRSATLTGKEILENFTPDVNPFDEEDHLDIEDEKNF